MRVLFAFQVTTYRLQSEWLQIQNDRLSKKMEVHPITLHEGTEV